MDNILEIFTVLTGLLFLALEIRQSRYLWAVQILTGAVSVYLFFTEGLYATMVLNLYYVFTALWGLASWKNDMASLADVNGADDCEIGKGKDSSSIHLRKITLKVLLLSLLLQIIGTCALIYILKLSEDPMPGLDAGITVLSFIATWWLVRTYKEQWLLWIVVDILTAIMCFSQGLYWMTGLYSFYTASAVYGYYHWNTNGEYIG